MLKSKFSAAASLLLVFVSGILVGVLAHRAYIVRASSSPTQPRKLGPSDWRKRNFAEMQSRLGLNAQQSEQLSRIFDQIDDRFRQIRSKWNAENQSMQKDLIAEIDSILTPEQREAYRKLREEREAERHRRRMEMEKSRGSMPPPPPPPEPERSK